MKKLFHVGGFLTYLAVLFLNAFVDLGHKIIIQNTLFKSYDGQEQIILTAIVNALILIPFVLLFTPSGYLADKFAKHQVMRISAWFALLLTLLITFSYYQGWFWFSFMLTFVLAIQSALYSPAKYGYIKELLGKKRLAAGNGMVQAATMIAILLSTFAFSLLFENQLSQMQWDNKDTLLQLIAPLGWLLVGMTLLELYCAYQIPQTVATQKNMRFDWKKYRTGKSQRDTLKITWQQPLIWQPIIGLSIFWAVSQVVLATYPAFIKEHLQIENVAWVQGIMACAGIGIMLGSFLVAYLSKQKIEKALIPIGAIGLSITVFLVTVFDSIALQAVNFIVLGIMGGLFVIPLRALMQYHTENHQLGRILASLNFIQNIIILSFLVLTIVFTQWGIGSTALFLLLSFILIITASYTLMKLIKSLIYFVIRQLFSLRYRLNIQGIEHIPSSQGILLLGNHVSWIDWVIIQMACPRRLHFVMEKSIYQKKYLKGFLDLFGVIPISHRSSRKSLSHITKLLNQGKAVCLFPEGGITRTGQLADFKRGYEYAAAGAKNAKIIPFYIHGLWGSRFSRGSQLLQKNNKTGIKRPLYIAFGKALSNDTGTANLKHRIFDLSVSTWQQYAKTLRPIASNWLITAKKQGRHLAIADILGNRLSHYRFITAVFRFAAKIAQLSPEQNIGLLLPTTSAGAIANMAVFTLGKTVVNLNYTAGKHALRNAVQQANVQTIYTSRQFLKRLTARGIDAEAIFVDTKLIFLEDLRAEMSKVSMLSTLLASVILPRFVLHYLYIHPVALDDTAAILFSSGSEGSPKGVELSHKNLAANTRQVAHMLNMQNHDVLLSSLPTFHAFGLLVTTLMPLREGIPIICHPDPTDVVTIAKGIARYKATILCSTSTFFRLYVRNKRVHPLMLDSLRLCIAGAEKLRPDVRDTFKHKFNKNIYEGYGATETSPAASANISDILDTTYWKIQTCNQQGSVGLPFSGTSFRIVDPDSLDELPIGTDGLILISGPQIMKGYLNAPEKTAAVIVEIAGERWYRSGDKGHVDAHGFLTIVDRYSRFAKIGGEMISLTAVEESVRFALKQPDLEVLALNIADAKKGEKIILLVTDVLSQQQLRDALNAASINPLMHPAKCLQITEIPTLGSGKIDFYAAKTLLNTLL